MSENEILGTNSSETTSESTTSENQNNITENQVETKVEAIAETEVETNEETKVEAIAETKVESNEEAKVEAVAETKVETNEETKVEAVAETEVVSNEAYQEAVLSKPVIVKDEQPTTIVDNSNKVELLAKLTELKNSNTAFDVVVTEKTTGGLRGSFEGYPVFIPFKLLSSGKNIDDAELIAMIGNIIQVKVEKVPTEDSISQSVVVSRKAVLEESFWQNIKVGDKITGPVTSVATFGVFIDLGGVEGLVHMSKLSNQHIKDTSSFAKVGDVLTAMVIDLDKSKSKVGLSMKELEPNAWLGAENKYPVGSTVKGKVKRIVDFGAYVELETGLDALLRISELSWTKRIRKMTDVLKVGEEIEASVLSVVEEKRNLALSLKHLTTNPWLSYSDKFNKENEYDGVVLQINDKGCVVTVENEVDAFMPKGRMRGVLDNNNIPYAIGDSIKVKVIDLVTDQESMIIAPVLTDEQAANVEADRESRNNRDGGDSRDNRDNNRDNRNNRDGGDRPRRNREDRDYTPIDKSIIAGGGMSFADLLSNKALNNLNKE